ncbi:hypothetical protein HK098_005384 [Nowakowskiella sp. JEL0407]|nr:hypothetical protein HK098_005384 [Nowakowskiella sp. JEL0407]
MYLDPRTCWELCKSSRYMYTLGPLPHQIDSILTGKVLDDEERLKIYCPLLNYCLVRATRCSHRLRSIASLLKIREWATNLETYYVSGHIPLIHDSEKVIYVRNPNAAKDAVVINFTEDITEFERTAFLESGKPAPFGMGHQTLVDFDVRKAVALSSSEFVYDLHRVLPIIMKQVTDALGTGKEAHAELYKMNVYEEGGFFKSHVDTPKSDQMFGSLVIGLPILHEGGELIVRHRDHTQTFSFKPRDRCELMWVAFYSDCEHEILPVQSGLRITLTFNLYWSDRKRSSSIELDVTKYPIYHMLKQIKDNQYFVKSGFMLGFGLQYAYPFESGEQVGKFEDSDKPVYEVSYNEMRFASASLENELNFGNSTLEDETNFALVVCDRFIGFRSSDNSNPHVWNEAARCIDSNIDKKLVWVTYAVNRFIAAQFIGRYGNEAVIDNSYVRAALIVSLTPAD